MDFNNEFIRSVTTVSIIAGIGGVILTVLLYTWIYETRKMVKEIHSHLNIKSKSHKVVSSAPIEKTQWNCPNCNTLNPGNASNCNKCGSRKDW